MNETTITILEVSDKGTQVKVKGQGQDGTHTYNMWKNKQDGSETQAYSLLKNKQINQQITFVWEEYHGEFQGKPYVSRTVKMAKDGGNANYQAPQATQPAPKANMNDDIRANVALKMVSELASAGKIDIKDWKRWTDTFYHYKPAFAQPPVAPTITSETPVNVPDYAFGGREIGDDEISVNSIPF